jgi:hypothetical protein
MFKKSIKGQDVTAEIKVATQNVFGRKSEKQLVEEIHETFYTEVDRLLAEAKVGNSLETDKQQLIDKCTRLKSLGFTSTKEVRDAENEIQRLNKLKEENKVKGELIEAINYFAVKYPNYKFITDESVKKICQKYGLVHGDITRYIGTVPDKNLKEMELFKIEKSDSAYFTQTDYYNGLRISSLDKKYISQSQLDEYKKRESLGDVAQAQFMSMRSNLATWEHRGECHLEIAAPIKDFDMSNMEVVDFKVKPMDIDPVVMKPVLFKGNKYNLIVTAWGDESEDEMVVNQKMN